jgi:hypothetical protein
MNVGSGDGYSLVWKDVYSFEGGKYVVTAVCAAAPGTQVVLTVNDQQHVGTVTAEGLSEVSFFVDLKKGANVITLGNPEVDIPAVDCITLQQVA